MTTKRSKRKTSRSTILKTTLVASGIAATLMGGDLLAREAWLDSVIDPIEAVELNSPALLPAAPRSAPTIVPYVSMTLGTSRQPIKPAPLPQVVFEPIPTVVVPNLQSAGSVSVAANQVNASVPNTGSGVPAIQFDSIPQVAQPNIPNRPNINTSTVSVDLPAIPEVAVPPAPAPAPAPATTSKSSK